MNRKQYNNVIENTLKYEQSAQTDDSLATARAIFDNMGVALPQGDMKTVYETIKTDNYMGWRSCTMQEAQEAANNGRAAIGISEDRIVVLSANDEEQPVAQTTSVMTLDENTSAFAVDGMRYYSYSCGSTTFSSNLTLSMLKQKFPHGKYWNHVGMADNNQNGYTDSPCNHDLYGTNYCNSFSLTGQDYSWQCMGFAERCGYDASGYIPRNIPNSIWKIYKKDDTKIDTLKAGDIVQYRTGTNPDGYHSIYITNVSGENITHGDCNHNDTCQIRWDEEITKSKLKEWFGRGGEKRHVRVAPTPLLP